jgi:hypothetical protein
MRSTTLTSSAYNSRRTVRTAATSSRKACWPSVVSLASLPILAGMCLYTRIDEREPKSLITQRVRTGRRVSESTLPTIRLHSWRASRKYERQATGRIFGSGPFYSSKETPSIEFTSRCMTVKSRSHWTRIGSGRPRCLLLDSEPSCLADSWDLKSGCQMPSSASVHSIL